MKRQTIVDYGDVHFPHQDDAALAVLERAIELLNPDLIVCGGDLMSCDAMTLKELQDADAAPKDWSEDELMPAIAHLNRVSKKGKRRLVFLEGNHEHRVEETLCNGGRALKSLRQRVSPRTLLPAMCPMTYVRSSGTRLDMSCNYSVTPSLVTTHGWNFCKHAAQRHLEQAKGKSVIFHHTHRKQLASTRDPWTGNLIEASSAGCLCSLQQHYHTAGVPTEWSHGFHVIHVMNGRANIYPVSIHKGTAVLPDGREV